MNSAIIVAGGNGTRMDSPIRKQYLQIRGREILSLSIDAFEKSKMVDEIVIVVPVDDIDYVNRDIADKYGFKKVRAIVNGGDTRQSSVLMGLLSCSSDTNLVAIHDGVRPFVSEKIIEDCFNGAKDYDAAACAVKVKDTLKLVDDEMFSIETPDRDKLYMVQTPQTFNYKKILEAHKMAKKDGFLATDDTQVAEAYGMKVKIVEGSYLNIKITTEEDLTLGKGILDYI